jgi:hypothetical protein
MSTLVGTVADVVTALELLVTDETFRRVHHGPQEQLTEFPCAEVIFGAGTVTRNQQQGFLERQHTRTGVVRCYAKRNSDLPAEFARLEPLVDAVEALFGALPRLTGAYDRFDATGSSAPAMETIGQSPVVWVDVSWSAIDAEAGAYVQDW